MFNFPLFAIVLSIGFMNVQAMSLKRSEKPESSLEKVEATDDPMKVNYDVYPVSEFWGRPPRSFFGLKDFHVVQQTFGWRFQAALLEFHASQDFAMTHKSRRI